MRHRICFLRWSLADSQNKMKARRSVGLPHMLLSSHPGLVLCESKKFFKSPNRSLLSCAIEVHYFYKPRFSCSLKACWEIFCLKTVRKWKEQIWGWCWEFEKYVWADETEIPCYRKGWFRACLLACMLSHVCFKLSVRAWAREHVSDPRRHRTTSSLTLVFLE